VRNGEGKDFQRKKKKDGTSVVAGWYETEAQKIASKRGAAAASWGRLASEWEEMGRSLDTLDKPSLKEGRRREWEGGELIRRRLELRKDFKPIMKIRIPL